MKILLHSSKTMKSAVSAIHEQTTPQFVRQAAELTGRLRSMDRNELASLMRIKEALAGSVKDRIDRWNNKLDGSATTVLTFRGDIYSGLAAAEWNEDDAIFAQKHLLILSGLYGLLRPFDAIKPYRLEMGYKLKMANGLGLDTFWEQQLSHTLATNECYVNLTAKEYFKVIQKQLSGSMVMSPKFLTISEKTKLPVFVTVHAKIARGSFASWLIRNKIDNPKRVTDYSELNYKYDKSLSTETEPVFICQKFGGLGLSTRLK